MPPSSGNHAAELMAIERTLSRFEAGQKVLILCDCQGAMRAIEEAWRSAREGEPGHDERDALRRRAGGTVIEAIIRHRRIHPRC